MTVTEPHAKESPPGGFGRAMRVRRPFPIPALSFVAGAILGMGGAFNLALPHAGDPTAGAAADVGMVAPGAAADRPVPADAAEARGANLAAARARVGAPPDEDEPTECPREWLQRWVAAGSPNEDTRQAMKMVQQWAAEDAPAVLAFIQDAPRFPDRLDALAFPLAVIGRGDPAFVIAWIQSNLAPEEQGEATANVIWQLDDVAPASALEIALAPGSPAEGRHCARLIGLLADKEPDRALAYFERLPQQTRQSAAETLASALFQVDPEAAVRWCESQKGSAHQAAAVRGLFGALLA
jgi:hypothetical protein